MQPDPIKDAEAYAHTCARAAAKRSGTKPEDAGLVNVAGSKRYFTTIRRLRSDARGGQWEIKLFTGETIRAEDADIIRHPAGTQQQGKLF